MPDMNNLSPEANAIVGAEDAVDLLTELRVRIMNGDLGDVEEAAELLVEGLEGTSVEVEDDDDVVAELVCHLWAQCHTVAQQWAEERTDVDRLMDAFESLVDEDISCGLFTDWPSLELSEEDRGGVLIWVNAWEDLSHEQVCPLMIAYTGSRLEDEEIGAELVAALKAQGLTPEAPTDGVVTVPVLWRWPVEHPDEL